MSQQADQLDAIAVIGIAGRFPDAASIDQFGKNLCAGLESVTTFTDEQLLAAGVAPKLVHAPNYVKAGVVLEGVELFDAEFFGYTPREAELTDPQHRMFLECAWEAMEDAGYDVDRTRLRVGVFAGTGANSYFEYNLLSHPDLISSLHHYQKSVASLNDHLSTRVSYKLNLKGPSLTIQTACSSALVATHIACQSLLNGECDMAIAGGVSLRIPQIAGYLYDQSPSFSFDGRCRAFDASAQGMMPGSGAGIVVLKRLSDALEDRDFIRAVIRGSAVNNDGAAKAGYTAPSIEGQATVIAAAQALAGVSADEISYIEAMGGGTPLGDPIEVAALTKAFRRKTQKRGFCAIGSVKTNIGHLGAASGIAGLIKTVWALQNRVLPPSLNFKEPNPAIDFQNSPFYVQQKLEPWQPVNGRRIAGVSAFAVGGTNAHVIVEEAPPDPAPDESRQWQLLPISAKSSTALEKATDRLAEFLAKHPAVHLPDVAFTLQQGRKAFAHQRILAVRSADEAAALLRTRDQKRVFTGVRGSSDCSVAFMFPGEIAHYVNMGLEIYLTEKKFKQHVDFCCEFLKPHLDVDLRESLYPAADKLAEASDRLSRAALAQTATFVVEYGLARLWTEWGVKPDAMIGHGVGEYVAACLAGVFSLEDALKLVAARGRLIQGLPRAATLAVQLNEESVRKYLGEELSLASVDGYESVVVGPPTAIQRLQTSLAKQQITYRMLQTSHAFYSQMTGAIAGSFRKVFECMVLNPPTIPYVSNLTGDWIRPAEATDPTYWSSHLSRTIRWADGIGQLIQTPNRILLEVGPGQTLAALSSSLVKAPDQFVFSSLGYAADGLSEQAAMMTTLGQLWASGVRPDWSALHAGQKRRRVPLPSYPFERRRYWIEAMRSSGRVSSVEETSDDSLNVPVQADSAMGRQRNGSTSWSTNSPASPHTDLEETVTAAWRDVLGFERIASDANFFKIGGDSLLAAQLLSRLRALLGVELPPNSVFLAPTIATLARLITKTAARGTNDIIVPLQKGSASRPPFFIIHSYHLYTSLPGALAEDQSFYGVEEFAVSDPVDNWGLESMMARYVEGIRSVEPYGPYFIGGFCSAAMPAFEVARQIEEAGESVPLLVIIDPVGTTRKDKKTLLERLRSTLVSTGAFWRFHIGKVKSLPATGVISYARHLAASKLRNFVTNRQMWAWKCIIRFYMRCGFKMPNRMRHKLIAGIRMVTLEAIRRYSPKPYKGDIAVFVATEMDLELQTDYVSAWRQVTTGNVRVIWLPGGHTTAFVEPNLTVFARELNEAFEAAIGAHTDTPSGQQALSASAV